MKQPDGKGPPGGPDDATALETRVPATVEPGTFAGEPAAPEGDQTLQGASFLVERITPAPPRRGEPAPLPEPPHYAVQSDAPTAAVQSPGLRPAPLMTAPAPAVAPGPGDVPPYVETAYVPVPGGAPPGQPTPLGVPAFTPPRPAPLRARLEAQIKALVRQIQGSKNARLGLIAGGGTLIIALLVVLLGRRPPPEIPAVPVMAADPAPVERPAPRAPAEPQDPDKVRERDRVLERAILAIEAGRTDEALAQFRRYTEEDPDPTAEFMVQLLQSQLAQSGKEQ